MSSDIVITPRWSIKPGKVVTPRRPYTSYANARASAGISGGAVHAYERQRSKIKQALGLLTVSQQQQRPQTSYTIREAQFMKEKVQRRVIEEKEAAAFRRQINKIRRHKLVGSPVSARIRKPCKVKLQPASIPSIQCKEDLVETIATPRPNTQHARPPPKAMSKDGVSGPSSFRFDEDEDEDEDEGEDPGDLILMGVRSGGFQNVDPSAFDDNGDNKKRGSAEEPEVEVVGSFRHFGDADRTEETEGKRDESSDVQRFVVDEGDLFNDDSAGEATEDADNEEEETNDLVLTHTSRDALKALFGE
eukprot:CAMPEP_0170199940 /NCGR_PEP_ID=MMETSP0040_2-20121228/69611_1 /TAXON_ID=641309 /ORGANISM="Lotharella oceanica, Strain CCMP622" /LENGTH=303 /DNA_ID=CAMNT_0010450101 /DNA_START=230 /DNA_END=1142 /DNA_ORIENTATION=-